MSGPNKLLSDFYLLLVIENNEILYRDYVDISVAVATPKVCITHVIFKLEKISFLKILEIGSEKSMVLIQCNRTSHEAISIFFIL